MTLFLRTTLAKRQTSIGNEKEKAADNDETLFSGNSKYFFLGLNFNTCVDNSDVPEAWHCGPCKTDVVL